MLCRGLLCLAVCLASLTALHAAPEKSGATDPDFFTMYRGWKQRVARLYQIQELYKTDPAADRKALEAEYNDILERAQTELLALNEAAVKSYVAAPNKNKELDTFLLTTLTGYVQSDDFENAARLAKVLIDHKLDAKELDLLAGTAMFATNDFENAETLLQKASDSAVISQIGRQYLESIDKYKELWAREHSLREAEDAANNLPKVKLTTTKGDIVVVLFENEAPIATANFISLVEKKFYDGLAFHRVIGGFMAQGGDPKGDGTGGPGYTIPCECYNENHRNHFRGSLSMAHGGKRNTGGSQFFINFVPTAYLDGKHTVFGRVVEGLDVLAKLQRRQPGDPVPADKIIKATVLFKRPHEYKPVTRPDKS